MTHCGTEARLQVITLDGPAGVGKSTLARRLATELGMVCLDTGAMYRTLGLKLGPEAADMPEQELRQRCAGYAFSLQKDGDAFVLLCNGVPVGDEIRTPRAGRLASLVAQLPPLREALREIQRGMAKHWPLVAEGRDMGTTVFPHADLKFFLDARPEVRAERRWLERRAKGEEADRDTILAEIIARDHQDRNREVDPLRPAPDAVMVDTSDLDIDGVLNVLLAEARKPRFSHLTEDGALRMVDVGAKAETERVAKARAVVEMKAETLDLLRRKALPKGDVLTTARVAGILAAKRTGELIPLCHPLAITFADVRFETRDAPPSVLLEAEVRTRGRTGVEMEAIVAVQIAAATIYDMCKAVQKDIVIRDVRLIYKSGGKSGVFQAPEPC